MLHASARVLHIVLHVVALNHLYVIQVQSDLLLSSDAGLKAMEDLILRVVGKVGKVASDDLSAQAAADTEAKERKAKSGREASHSGREASRPSGWGSAMGASKLGQTAGVSSVHSSSGSIRPVDSVSKAIALQSAETTSSLRRPVPAPKLLQRPDR